MAVASATRLAQHRFAAAIAAGHSQTTAYKLAHPKIRMNAKSLHTAAQRAAQRPAVQAEIQRLMGDPVMFIACPEAADPTIVRAHGVAIMSRLARSSNELVAAHCAEWLVSYADALELQQRQAQEAKRAPDDEKQRLLADLRGLYQRALAPPAEALVETVVEPVPAVDPEQP